MKGNAIAIKIWPAALLLCATQTDAVIPLRPWKENILEQSEDLAAAAAHKISDLQDLIPRRRRPRSRLLRLKLNNPLRRRRSSGDASSQQPVHSRKKRMYVTCFGIVFAW